MINSIDILRTLKFSEELNFDRIPQKRIKERNLYATIYEGSLENFNHSFISKFEYSLDHDKRYSSLEIYIELSKADKVLKMLQENAGIKQLNIAILSSEAGNPVRNRIFLEDEIVLDFVVENDFLIVQFFKFK